VPRTVFPARGAIATTFLAVAAWLLAACGAQHNSGVEHPRASRHHAQSASCAGPPPRNPQLAPVSCWRPYSPHSPFNRRLPASPPLDPDSARIVQWLTSSGSPADLTLGVAGTAHDFSHPVYYSRPSDPRFTIHCTQPWGHCPLEGQAIRIPSGARPAGGSDGHMAVVDLRRGMEYDMWQAHVPPEGGVLTISWGGRTRLHGMGLGSNATAAHFGLLAGIIRAPELEAGRIDHALVMVTDCTNGFVPPASGGGLLCSGQPGAPDAGMRFQLAMSDAQIDELGLPAWKKAILRAMADYGAYVEDTSGVRGWGVELESGSTYTSFGRPDQLVSVARQDGIPSLDGHYTLDLGSGIDWRDKLRVIAPCVSEGRC